MSVPALWLPPQQTTTQPSAAERLRLLWIGVLPVLRDLWSDRMAFVSILSLGFAVWMLLVVTGD